MVKFDKNIPAPGEAGFKLNPFDAWCKANDADSVGVFGKMEVGDSFRVPCDNVERGATLSAAASNWLKHVDRTHVPCEMPKAFRGRWEDGGIRVWRIR